MSQSAILTASGIRAKKNREILAVLTAYDYPSALMIDGVGLDIVLVGDSLGEVIHGFPDTTHVTTELMCLHTAAVRRGLKQTHLMADMPFHTYEDPVSALENARRLIRVGADSLKLENPKTEVVETLVAEGIAVFGHVGLTPQTIHPYKKQGKDPESAKRILNEAKRQEAAGCFGLVIEAVPDELASEITHSLAIPTVGIAAGTGVDGQVLVFHDLFGFYARDRSYVKKRADVFGSVEKAARDYVASVKNKL
ncbi:MAG: 3-methyl-2-oxobutanoate hydroxymethyltransferase [Spirochaetia bacterium]|nr:3-methyl-2-oxobutanoate hydroxymethyltransferase [Spirochaetia bacterium]